MQSIFGTDGVRGRFNQDIDCDLAYKIGYAFGKNTTINEPILIGRDTRTSGQLLLDAISAGINSAKKEVFDIGICPTPAIPFLIKKINSSGGIMISASHNPPEYNGIKIFNRNGIKIKQSEERALERLIASINNKHHSKSNSEENVSPKNELIHLYEESLIESVGNIDLNGLKIVLDTCFGSATVCAEKIFKKLGANTKTINNKPDGERINVGCGSTCLKPLQKAVIDNEADMGFSFDGDADRVIGIDSRGNILDGDHILFLWGRELLVNNNLPKKEIISTIMANLGLEKGWQDLGGIFYRTPVGDKFIYEEIIKRKAVLGGEQSGHILSKINNFCGDGILTAIQISKFCKIKKIKLETWLESSFSPFPQKLTNIFLPLHLKKSNLYENQLINEIVQKYLDKNNENCRIFVRPSGTEPLLRILVEAHNQKLVNSISTQIKIDIEKLIDNF